MRVVSPGPGCGETVTKPAQTAEAPARRIGIEGGGSASPPWVGSEGSRVGSEEIRAGAPGSSGRVAR